jgi:spoIIIJ-associated protein
MKEKIKLVESVTKELLDLLGIKSQITSVDWDKSEGLYKVQIEAQDAGILIGRHGETLNAFQTIIRQIVYLKTKENVRILVNIGDWRQKREEVLRKIAQDAREKAKEGQPQHIYDLSPAERRFIHLLFSNDPEFTTESEGEGRSRHIVIKPRTANLT